MPPSFGQPAAPAGDRYGLGGDPAQQQRLDRLGVRELAQVDAFAEAVDGRRVKRQQVPLLPELLLEARPMLAAFGASGRLGGRRLLVQDSSEGPAGVGALRVGG